MEELFTKVDNIEEYESVIRDIKRLNGGVWKKKHNFTKIDIVSSGKYIFEGEKVTKYYVDYKMYVSNLKKSLQIKLTNQKNQKGNVNLGKGNKKK